MPSFIFSPVEKIVNYGLSLDPNATQYLIPLTGKILKIELVGMPFDFFLKFTKRKIFFLTSTDEVIDTRIVGSPVSLLSLLLAKGDPEKNYRSAVSIIGDTDVAQRVSALFAKLDIDWEEQLSGVVGDMAARIIAQTFRNLVRWGASTKDLLQQNLTEFIQEELELLPSMEEVEYFLSSVDKVRDNVERLSARINKLKQKQELHFE